MVALCLAAAAAQASTPAEVSRVQAGESLPFVPALGPADRAGVAPVAGVDPVAGDPVAGDRVAGDPVAGDPVAPPVAAVEGPPAALPIAFTRNGDTGIPENVLNAYRAAEAHLARHQPGCGLRWYHVAGIGRIESGHARGGQATPTGDTSPHILGPVLAGGPGMAAIHDTDNGTLDGDGAWDRAVGPMQFIPSTWAFYRTDGNADGTSNPHNIYDAAAAAGRYLCSGGLNLADQGDLAAAVFRYNHSREYVSTVMTWMHTYSAGAIPLPARPAGPLAAPSRATHASPLVATPVQAPSPLTASSPLTATLPIPAPAPSSPTLTPSPTTVSPPTSDPAPEPTTTAEPTPRPVPRPEPIPLPEPIPAPPTECPGPFDDVPLLEAIPVINNPDLIDSCPDTPAAEPAESTEVTQTTNHHPKG
jgi:membrane-bound lytic murein transglycosylase B